MQLLCCFVGIFFAESNAFVNHGINWAKIRGLHTLQAAELSVITVDFPRKRRRIVVVGGGWAGFSSAGALSTSPDAHDDCYTYGEDRKRYKLYRSVRRVNLFPGWAAEEGICRCSNLSGSSTVSLRLPVAADSMSKWFDTSITFHIDKAREA